MKEIEVPRMIREAERTNLSLIRENVGETGFETMRIRSLVLGV